MPDVTIVYWRDIPAQVIVGKGRRGTKKPLPERFEQAIDRAAMKVGAKDADAYLAEWRRADPYSVEGEPDAVAEAEADLGDTGRVLLRPSGTEPLVRVMVEAGDQSTADRVAGELAEVVRQRLSTGVERS